MYRLSRIASLLAVTLSAAQPAVAQNAPAPRVEIGFSVGLARPTVVMTEPGGLRFYPIARANGDAHVLKTLEIIGRVQWNRRTHTAVGVSWPSEAEKSYEYERPLIPPEPPFTTYRSRVTTTYRYRSFHFAQLFDVPLSRAVVPFLGGGVEFRSVARTEHKTELRYVDSAPAFQSVSKTDGSQQSVFATAGVRAQFARLVTFVDAKVFLRTSETEFPGLSLDGSSRYGAINWRSTAGIGVRF